MNPILKGCLLEHVTPSPWKPVLQIQCLLTQLAFSLQTSHSFGAAKHKKSYTVKKTTQ